MKTLSGTCIKTQNLKRLISFSEDMAHLIEAGSDFFLMPSRYEPCGLNQMYSLRYGAIPIVHSTGGLKDSVEPYDSETGSGTGFLFYRMDQNEIFSTVAFALRVFNEKPDHIVKMRKTGMKKRFSWDASAKKYEDIYESALKKQQKRE